MPVISDRLQNLPPYVFAVISQQVREMQQSGIDVVRMDIGSPDLPPPDFVLDALDQSARNSEHHGYSGYRGIARFREAVARYYNKRFGVILDPESEVLPLIGSKEGIVNLCLAYLDRGDIALVPAVGYPVYAMGARLAGADIYHVSMPAENSFLLDVADLPPETLQKAKILWANYPNNPTGAVADVTFFQHLADFCAENDILLASDNPYCDVTYDGYHAPSALQVDRNREHVIEFMSMSKTFNMAGWRLGAAVGSSEALEQLLVVKSNVDSGHFIPAYDAGITAMDGITDSWLSERNAIYRERRDIIINGLSEIGLEAQKPHGSLYVWARSLEIPPMDYAERARSEAHVSLAPGIAYGPGGEAYLRMSVTQTSDRLIEGMARLKRWYNNRT